MKRAQKFYTLYFLIILIFFQEISGLFSGIALAVDPAGKLLQMPVSMLEGSPFGTTHSQNRDEVAGHKK